ncbi:MAG: AAC(3) family N-acetyltransferase, partial [Blastomonas sp.]|nr:AAC(3) family N-acetyltransferase [Blastomonas sp.]
MTHFWTIEDLVRDLAALGLGKGDIVLGHAGLRSIEPMIAGPDTLIAALRQVVGADGTIMAYADWQGAPEGACDEQGHILPEWPAHGRPFDPPAPPATPGNGPFPQSPPPP